MTAEQQIRAAALAAACTWLSGIDPYPVGRRMVLETAEEFARWIEGDEK